jgi:hypothetical protein
MSRRKNSADEKHPCWWRADGDGNWDTDCGEKFVFIEAGPTENGMKFCCYCGKPLKEGAHD